MSAPLTTMRIEADVKERAKPILEELGLNISSATNLFLKAVIRHGGLPFDLRLTIDAPAVDHADFVADYLAPIMRARNEITRVGYDPAAFRRRLVRRKELITEGRRVIP